VRLIYACLGALIFGLVGDLIIVVLSAKSFLMITTFKIGTFEKYWRNVSINIFIYKILYTSI